MKGNVETPGNGLSWYGVMGLPVNLGIEVIAIGIEVPASNTNDRVIVGAINDLHVPNCRIAGETTSLFVEVESQPGFRFFSRRHRAADWRRGGYEVLAWWVRGSVGHEYIEILKL